MTIRRVRQILYTAAGMGSLALGGCAGVAPPPPSRHRRFVVLLCDLRHARPQSARCL
ncbi:hypothetical protein [Acidithiobacillus ferriphilus]|uniref:hypothetical protein n=1 Tax=Acidithiobacillus ferriphilus TaxID=1689834 RepID=UPI001E3D38E7|nr:hypothetical protein [Acidithiobacillus ferriphilus]